MVNALSLASVIRELHRVDRVDVETEQLQGEHRAFVAHITTHDV